MAYSWGRLNISKGNEIVLSVAEHHSNFVPWQQLVAENGAVLKIVPITDSGELDLEALKNALTKKTKLVTLFHVSNVLGTINPIKEISKTITHTFKPKPLILVDGAQAIPHMPVNIPEIGADFYVFTGHKMLAPTGVGILWGRKELLEVLPPFLFGGEMISKVDFDKSTWNEVPWRFEAGTPDISAVIGLGAAVDYLSKIGMENIRKHEKILSQYALEQLAKLPFVSIYGTQPTSLPRSAIARLRDGEKLRGSRNLENRAGVISFNVGNHSTSGSTLRDKPSGHSTVSAQSNRSDSKSSGPSVHAHDVAQILDGQGIAIRSGHHCAQPLMKFLGITSAARVSFYLYNTKEEVDRLVEGLKQVVKIFQKKKVVTSQRQLPISHGFIR